jgi:hypothetical protein
LKSQEIKNNKAHKGKKKKKKRSLGLLSVDDNAESDIPTPGTIKIYGSPKMF